MNKHFTRLIALLLTPFLVVDPVIAAGQIREAPPVSIGYVPIEITHRFQSEALSAGAVWERSPYFRRKAAEARGPVIDYTEHEKKDMQKKADALFIDWIKVMIFVNRPHEDLERWTRHETYRPLAYLLLNLIETLHMTTNSSILSDPRRFTSLMKYAGIIREDIVRMQNKLIGPEKKRSIPRDFVHYYVVERGNPKALSQLGKARRTIGPILGVYSPWRDVRAYLDHEVDALLEVPLALRVPAIYLRRLSLGFVDPSEAEQRYLDTSKEISALRHWINRNWLTWGEPPWSLLPTKTQEKLLSNLKSDDKSIRFPTERFIRLLTLPKQVPDEVRALYHQEWRGPIRGNPIDRWNSASPLPPWLPIVNIHWRNLWNSGQLLASPEKVFHELTRKKLWTEMSDTDIRHLKWFVRQAYQQHPEMAEKYLSSDVLKQAFSTEKGIWDLVRRSHPYTLDALDALKTGRMTVREKLHEAVYYWLYARKLRGEEPVEVINLDPHADIQKMSPDENEDVRLTKALHQITVMGVDDGNWAAASVQDGLTPRVLQVMLVGNNQYLLPVSEVILKQGKTDWQLFSDQTNFDLPLTHPSLLTVDLDAYSLRRHHGVHLYSYHSNLEQVAQGTDTLIRTLMSKYAHPLGLVTAISPSYLNYRRILYYFVGRSWVNEALFVIEKKIEAAFRQKPGGTGTDSGPNSGGPTRGPNTPPNSQPNLLQRNILRAA